MSKIEKLTKEQKLLFSVYRDKWIKIGLSTKPADRQKAESAIKEMYNCAGLPPLEKIIWCDSPLSQGLTIAIISNIRDLKAVEAPVRDSVKASVEASVRDSVRASVETPVWDSVRASVENRVWTSVWDSVGNSVRALVGNSVGNSVENLVRTSVWDSVGNSVRALVGNSVGNSVGGSVGASVGASVWDSVGNLVRTSVWNSVENSVGNSVKASVRASVYGQHEAHWLSFYDYCKEVLSLKKETKKLNGLWNLAKSAGWALPYQKICWVSERPNDLKKDENGRLHNLNGPSIMYPDGWSIYAIHGVRAPDWIIERPHEITTNKIETEHNVEIKRVMIERYGQDRYLLDSGAKEIHKDKYGTLYFKEIANDEPLVMVKVVDSTAESNGKFKEYFLRVKPDIKTAKEAVAWTFGMKENEYQPHIET